MLPNTRKDGKLPLHKVFYQNKWSVLEVFPLFLIKVPITYLKTGVKIQLITCQNYLKMSSIKILPIPEIKL